MNWKNMIEDEMDTYGDSFAWVVSCTLSDKEIEEKFNCGYGGTEGKPFTIWTESRVYFPICYDGSEWVGSASRNPDGIALEHQGGG